MLRGIVSRFTMQKLVIVTYVLRGLGLILVLLTLFGHEIILNLFPGLEGQSDKPIFYAGIVVYLIGLHTTAVADDALVTDALVLAAGTLVVLRRTEDALAEQTVTLRLVGTIVDGLRLCNLTK